MALKAKYEYRHEEILRDSRPWIVRKKDQAREPGFAACVFVILAGLIADPFGVAPEVTLFSDLIFFFSLFYFWWLKSQQVKLPFNLPKSANRRDPNNKKPDGSFGFADGILYLGNETDTNEEIWFTNSNARTHCLYLGTTGAGKTVGLKSYACNALCWASGFIYIDGKADTSLWSTISAQVRRFGRDDDLLIMNYMTGNVTGKVPSNTLNPFSAGSASYLTNMLVSLMPDAEGDNAMWKERAVALVSALMPCLVYKRENQNIPLSIGVIRTYLTFKAVIRLSRDVSVPETLRAAVKAYLAELPGYDDRMFDDDGNTKQQPDGSMPDTSTPNQQHGYLSMQFTRSMQSLGDDYGFIFDTQAADVDMLDVVLNRRILIVLIPALEKSSDETANLGKIISSTLKGMMGATLGNTVEGDSATVIDNKPTNSSTPFIAIFDEVGYYTAQGMAVMAAQARSLGFSLVFAGQDLPALEKRVKEEARSITANCNIKLFGKLEDPTQTKEFFEKTVGNALVTEVSGFARGQGGGGYSDSQQASVQQRARASYDGLKGFNEGQAICAFGKSVKEMQVYYADIGDAKAMRVHRFLPIPPPSEDALDALRMVDSVLRRLRNPKWKPDETQTPSNRDIEAMAKGFAMAKNASANLLECGITSVGAIAEAHDTIEMPTPGSPRGDTPAAPPVSPAAEKAAQQAVAATVPGGPLNWMEVIGTPEASATPLRRDPPVTEKAASAQSYKVEDTPKPVSWEDIVAGAGGGAAPASPKAAEKAAGAALKAPLSWMDVLGTADSSVGPNAVADQQPQATAPVAPAAAPPAAPVAQPPAAEAPAAAAMPWDMLGKMLPPKETPAPQGMTWADVLGSDEDDRK